MYSISVYYDAQRVTREELAVIQLSINVALALRRNYWHLVTTVMNVAVI